MKKWWFCFFIFIVLFSLLSIVSAEDVNSTGEIITCGDSDTVNDAQEINNFNTLNKKESNKSTKEATYTNKTGENGDGCCSVIVQGYNNDTSISFRRDNIQAATINIRHNNTYIKQYKAEGTYFLHVLISNDGWMLGNGGSDYPSTSSQIESTARSIMENNNLNTKTFNKLVNLKNKASVSHIVIKAPDGRYALYIKYNSRQYRQTGVLSAGQYISVPNNPSYLRKGYYQKITGTDKIIYSSKKLAATDKFGVNRRNIFTYYHKQNIDTSRVEIYSVNDDGRFVNRKTGSSVDSIRTNTNFINSRNIPRVDGWMHIENINFNIKSKTSTATQTNPQVISGDVDRKGTVITLNTIPTSSLSQNITITGKLTDDENNNLILTPVVLKVNSHEYHLKTDGKGQFKCTVTAEYNGINNVTATYNGNLRYDFARSDMTFRVANESVLTVDSIAGCELGDEILIRGRFTDNHAGALRFTPLLLEINNNIYTVKTDTGGYFAFKTKASTLGRNNITVSYGGNSRYAYAVYAMSFVVGKKTAKLTLNTISRAYLGNTITVVGTFSDRDDNHLRWTPLSVRVNSNSYAVKTNGKGLFKLKVKLNRLGKNKITVTYNGNVRYKTTTIRKSFTVNRMPTKIAAEKIRRTKINTKIKVKGKLFDRNNVPLVNSKVKIKYNKKNVTIKTNSKGKFEYELMASHMGTNRVLLSYAGSKRYDSSRKAITFNVS